MLLYLMNYSSTASEWTVTKREGDSHSAVTRWRDTHRHSKASEQFPILGETRSALSIPATVNSPRTKHIETPTFLSKATSETLDDRPSDYRRYYFQSWWILSMSCKWNLLPKFFTEMCYRQSALVRALLPSELIHLHGGNWIFIHFYSILWNYLALKLVEFDTVFLRVICKLSELIARMYYMCINARDWAVKEKLCLSSIWKKPPPQCHM